MEDIIVSQAMLNAGALALLRAEASGTELVVVSVPVFQLCDPLFECFQFFARAPQHLRLNIEFFTTDEIKFFKKPREKRAGVFFDIGDRAGRDDGA